MKTTWMIAALVAAASSLSAYEVRSCRGDKLQWPSNPDIQASTPGFPEGHSRRIALAAVVRRWNNSPANFRFNIRWNDDDVELGNGENEVWFTYNSERLDKDVPAAAFHWDNCLNNSRGVYDRVIVEKDIVFACDPAWPNCAGYDDPVAWYFGTLAAQIWSYGGPERPFRTTAMHELGHALGLYHENDEYNIMGDDWTHVYVNGTEFVAYPGEDASDGAIRLYGSHDPRREDVAVVHWRRCDPAEGPDCDGGEYSVHTGTRLFNENGVELPNYRVVPAQRILAEFTFENNGSTTQTPVAVEFYVSTDKVLDAQDLRVGQAELRLERGDVYTRLQTIDLPASLNIGGAYYILARIDPSNAIAETYEDNNLAFSRRFRVN